MLTEGSAGRSAATSEAQRRRTFANFIELFGVDDRLITCKCVCFEKVLMSHLL